MSKSKTSRLKSAAVFISFLTGSVGLSAVANAQQRMPVPSDPSANIEGCWRGSERLYGQFRFEFCLQQWTNGLYRVDGQGLSCEGDLNWSRSGRSVSIRLRPTRCDRSTDWSPDIIKCTVGRTYGDLPMVRTQGSPQTRMPVPSGGNRPSGPSYNPPAELLTCEYVPTAGRYRVTRIDFVRDGGQWGNHSGGRWDELGCERVSGLFDRHVIRVMGRDQNRYRAIKLAVRENNVNLMKMRVTYGNGRVEELPVRSTLLSGTETHPIDLTSGNRGLREIELHLLRFFGGRKATVCAYALQ